MSKKYHIKTYGCQMNVYDSTRMGDVLAPLGYTATDAVDDADLVILNTCHIREKASEKVYSELGRIREHKDALAKTGRQMVIGVAGCVAQAEGDEIRARAPYVDLVFGSQSYHKLPEMLGEVAKSNPVVELEFPEIQKFDLLPETQQSQGSSAFVAVQEGCDKFCTFCVVPYTRGAEYSRPVAALEKEIRALVEGGAIEITLLGQNVNAYHGAGPDGSEWRLGDLIRHLAKIDGLQQIRYTTSHPNDMDESLIRAHAEEEKLMPFLHLPIQAGSNSILKKMNRKHTAEHYIGLIERIRAARPDIAFSSDFIVGFPGETDADFEDTMRIVETVGYAQCYSFKYSPRPGTPAAGQETQVAEEVKDERLQRLQALIQRQQLRFNQSSLGREMPILLEREGKFAGQMIGKSPYMQSVHVVDTAHLAGKLVNVRIVAAHQNSLTGELLPEGARKGNLEIPNQPHRAYG